MPNEGTLHDLKLWEASGGQLEHLEIVKEFQGRLSSGPVLAADPSDHQVLADLVQRIGEAEGQTDRGYF